MCQALRELMKDDLEKREQETLLTAIKNLMDNLKLSSEQAMAALNIPVEDRPGYSDRL